MDKTSFHSKPARAMRGSVCAVLCLAAFVCSGARCAAEDECIFGEGSGAPAAPAANPPRPIDSSWRIVSPEVRAYLDQRLQQMEIIATTTTKRGSVYDWIYPESQVPGGQIGSPPPLNPPGDTSPDGDACRPTAARGELEEEPGAWGPPGTVPVLRVDPDRIYAPGTVADFLSKYGNAFDIPVRPVDPQVNLAAGHFHAGTEMTVTNYGGEGYISVWQPWVVVPTEMSLAQMAVISVSSTGAVRETIEAGWHVYGTLYGDFATRFFIYFTTNGYTQPGPKTGSYNMRDIGWVQTSRTITPGTIITPLSVVGGEQVDAYIRMELHEGKWWIRFKDEFVGYYPASLFAADGLGTSASHIQFFGETFDDPKIPGMTVSDMGSGLFPGTASWARNAAYMRFLQVQDTPQGYDRKPYLADGVLVTNPKCYDHIGKFDPNQKGKSQQLFGGPGQNQQCP